MKKTLKVEGMMCGHCEARVKKALEALPEVAEAVVSHAAGTAIVTQNAEVADDVQQKALQMERPLHVNRAAAFCIGLCCFLHRNAVFVQLMRGDILPLFPLDANTARQQMHGSKVSLILQPAVPRAGGIRGCIKQLYLARLIIKAELQRFYGFHLCQLRL